MTGPEVRFSLKVNKVTEQIVEEHTKKLKSVKNREKKDKAKQGKFALVHNMPKSKQSCNVICHNNKIEKSVKIGNKLKMQKS